MTLRTRIAAVAGIAVALTAVALAGAQYAATRSTLRGEIDTALTERSQGFVIDRRDGDGDRHPPPQAGDVRPVPFGGASGSVQLVGPAGAARLLGPDDSALPVDTRTKQIAAAGSGRHFRDVDVDGVHLRVLAVGLGERGAVQIARPLTEVDRSLRELLVVLAVVGGAGILVAALLGALVARAALAPVRRFTRRTEQLTGNPDLSQRLDADGRDELARLAHSFNTTLDALEASAEAQRQLVADASHELRTPIASLRTNVQVLEEADRLPPEEREALRADVVAELDELTALVSDIVELARGSKPGEAVDDVALDELVASVVDRAARRAGDDVRFESTLEPTLVTGDAQRIARAVSNLLDNARKWSPPGGVVEVSLSGGTLTIRDHGPGFVEADLPHVFDRFYRAASARRMPGSGLGLAIVRQAAESHDGTVAAANAQGGGALVEIGFGPSTARETAAAEALTLDRPASHVGLTRRP